MANPTQGTTVPTAVTFNADGLSNKSGTIRQIVATEVGVLYLVSYSDSDGGVRSIWLKATDITIGA